METKGLDRYRIDFSNESELTKYFAILPEDWKVELQRTLESYQSYWSLVLIYLDDTVVGGGLLFDDLTKDVKMYETDVKYLVDLGYLYIAYVWITPEHRGFKLGNLWLDYVQNNRSVPGFWLAIEDQGLIHFYEASKFLVRHELNGPDGLEWIMVSNR